MTDKRPYLYEGAPAVSGLERLRRILILLGFIVGTLLAMALDALPLAWILYLSVTFFALVGGVFAVTYAMKGK